MLRLLCRLVLSLALCFALLSPCTAQDIPASGALDAAQAAMIYERHTDGALPGLIFLDVRTPGEFRAGHVQGALNIPVQELGRRLAEVPDGPVVIICRSGRRAKNAYDILVNSGRRAEQLWYYVGYTDYDAGTPRFRN